MALRKNASKAAVAKYARRQADSIWSTRQDGQRLQGLELEAWYALKTIADTLEGKRSE